MIERVAEGRASLATFPRGSDLRSVLAVFGHRSLRYHMVSFMYEKTFRSDSVSDRRLFFYVNVTCRVYDSLVTQLLKPNTEACVIKTVMRETRHDGKDCHCVSCCSWVFNGDCFHLTIFCCFVSEHCATLDTLRLKVEAFSLMLQPSTAVT